MRLKLLVIASLCLAIQPIEKASSWTPCMPFCDTMCTGTAAISLTSTVASQYGSLSSQVLRNTESVGRLTNSFMQQQAKVYSQDTLSSQQRITAYDGVSKTITFTLEKYSKIYERLVDHISTELFNMKQGEKIGSVAYENAKSQELASIPISDNALKAIPQLASEITANQVRFKEAATYQIEMSKTITSDAGGIQIPLLMNDIDFSIPNPFTVDIIDEEHWESYQKLLTLIFNSEDISGRSSINERQRWVKKQVALLVVSKALSEMVKIPSDRANELLALTGESDVTIKSALFERYKNEMLNVNTQTQTKASSIKSLLVIYNMQLAQKNLLLNEIKNTKQMKNSLLAISGM
ncbi:MAG: hypothetical protein JJV99_07065 [Colwellia sp.]|nr:hypothetical protein [Colwellia sp.]